MSATRKFGDFGVEKFTDEIIIGHWHVCKHPCEKYFQSVPIKTSRICQKYLQNIENHLVCQLVCHRCDKTTSKGAFLINITKRFKTKIVELH